MAWAAVAAAAVSVVGSSMMSGGGADTSGINQASAAQVQLGKDALAWYQKTYEGLQPQLASAADTENQISSSQLALGNTAATQAANQNKYFDQNFKPLMSSIVSDASTYGDAAHQEAAAGRAAADVTQAAGNAQDQQMRALTRMGVNPNSGRALAVRQSGSMQQAAMTAGAMNKARVDTQKTGFDMKTAAANMGNTVLTNATQNSVAGANALSQSAATASLPISQQISAAGLMGQGFNVASAANSSSGSMQGTIAGLNQSATNSNNALLGNLGSSVAYTYGNKKPSGSTSTSPAVEEA